MYASQIVAVYKGIIITRSEGLYSCLLDFTLESECFSDIVYFIDNYLYTPMPEPIVDNYIIGEYVFRCNMSNLKN